MYTIADKTLHEFSFVNSDNQLILYGGTNSTWFYYQKLINAVFFAYVKSKYINFHEKAFLTELSEVSAQRTNKIDNSI